MMKIWGNKNGMFLFLNYNIFTIYTKTNNVLQGIIAYVNVNCVTIAQRIGTTLWVWM